jgi:hypothetical protein
VNLLVSFLILEEMFSFFPPFTRMLAMALLYTAFILLRSDPSLPSFFRTFIIKECWILSNSFSASVEMIVWFLSLILLMCWLIFIDFHILNCSSLEWNQLDRGVWSFSCCWIQCAGILLRIFASTFVKINISSSLFLLSPLVLIIE